MIQRIIEYVFVIALKILASTWRMSVKGEYDYSKAVIAFWHGKMLPCWKLFSNQNVAAAISLSKDGELLSKLLHSWNYTVLRGSSSKGGKEVLDKMVVSSYNNILLITPDGPKGPINITKPGAVIVAQRAEVPLILCRVEINNKLRLKSWDKFEIPYPFTKISIQFLPPIFIPKDTDRTQVSAIIDSCNNLLF